MGFGGYVENLAMSLQEKVTDGDLAKLKGKTVTIKSLLLYLFMVCTFP